jgi:hypothetical protein
VLLSDGGQEVGSVDLVPPVLVGNVSLGKGGESNLGLGLLSGESAGLGLVDSSGVGSDKGNGCDRKILHLDV